MVGGIWVLYKSKLKLRQFEIDVAIDIDSFEYVVVSDCTRRVNFVVVYRPPPSRANNLTVGNFLSQFDSFVTSLNDMPGILILLGDFNIHHDDVTNRDVARFDAILRSANLLQNVKQPTHNQGHILDLIITRATEAVLTTPYVHDITLSDHFMIDFKILYATGDPNVRIVKTRNFHGIDHDDFGRHLASKLSKIDHDLDVGPNSIITKYNDAIKCVLNSHAPMRIRRCNTPKKPCWFTDAIIEARRRKRQLERRWRKSGSAHDYGKYKDSLLELKELLTQSKRGYYTSALLDSTPKTMFATVNTLLNNNSRPLPHHDNPKDPANDFS